MNDYDERKNELEYERRKIMLAMEIYLSLIEFKSEKQKNSILDRIDTMTRTNIESARLFRDKILNELSKSKNKTTGRMELMIADEVVKLQNKHSVNLDKDDILEIAENASKDPIKALTDNLSKYIFYKINVKSLEEQKNNYESSNEEYDYESFKELSEEEIVNLVDESIDKAIENNESLNDDEKDRLLEAYPELSSIGDYYTADIVNDALILNSIVEKDISSTGSTFASMSVLSLNLLVRNLLFKDYNSPQPKIFNKLGIDDTYDKFVKGYNKFREKYDKLDINLQVDAKKQIGNNVDYVSAFGENIVYPEQFKRVVNECVTSYIVDNYDTYYKNDDFYGKTLHATKLMAIDDIESLYKQLKDKIRNSRVDSQLSINTRDHKLASLQLDFARVILTRLEEHNKDVDITKLDESELHEYYEERDKRLIGICHDILGEDVLDEQLKEVEKNNSLDGVGTNLKETHDAKESAKNQVYGLSETKKALVKITNKWSRYVSLMDKDNLSKSEREELQSIFKKRN